MARVRRISSVEVLRLLAEHGFVKIRQRGSHIVMQKRITGSTITVIVPDHKEIRTGTLLSLIRQSGLPRDVFE